MKISSSFNVRVAALKQDLRDTCKGKFQIKLESQAQNL